MCRNITTLRGLEPVATPEEMEAAARQYVRKVSGVQSTSPATEEAVERALGGRSEAELIDAFIERRMHAVASGGPIEDEKKLAAAYRKLRRAGFTSGPILAALKRIAARPDELEELPEEESED